MANWVTRAKHAFVGSLACLMGALPSTASFASGPFDSDVWFKSSDSTAPQYGRVRDNPSYNQSYDARVQVPQQGFGYVQERRDPRHDRQARRSYQKHHRSNLCLVEDRDVWGRPLYLEVPCKEVRRNYRSSRYVDLADRIHIRTHSGGRYKGKIRSTYDFSLHGGRVTREDGKVLQRGYEDRNKKHHFTNRKGYNR